MAVEAAATEDLLGEEVSDTEAAAVAVEDIEETIVIIIQVEVAEEVEEGGETRSLSRASEGIPFLPFYLNRMRWKRIEKYIFFMITLSFISPYI